MRFAQVFSALAVASLACASPLKRSPVKRATTTNFTDIDVVQYGLSLEHIEAELFRQFKANFTSDDFKNGGYPDFYYGRYQQLANNEETHTVVLTAALEALGIEPVVVCNYTYPINNLDDFINLSHTLDNAGSSAWAYAAANIQDPTISALATSILGTEARHASWVASTVFHQNPWNSPFETPLNFRQLYTIAKAFIVSCPADFPNILGYGETFPHVDVNVSYPNATLTFPQPSGSNAGQPLFAAFIQGVNTTYVPIDASTNSITFPDTLTGYAYILVSTQGEGELLDNNTLAGPTILTFPFDAAGALITDEAGNT